MMFPLSRVLRRLLRRLAIGAAALLGGCNMVLLHPSGDVAVQQGQLIVTSTLLMLLIIVPVIVLTVLLRLALPRSRNTQAHYDPEWDHSIQLELVIWAAPLLIIIALGALTWISTHTLDPVPAARAHRCAAARYRLR